MHDSAIMTLDQTLALIDKVIEHETTAQYCRCKDYQIRKRKEGKPCKHMEFLPLLYQLLQVLDHPRLRHFYLQQRKSQERRRTGVS